MAKFNIRFATVFNVRPGEGWPLALLLIHAFAHGLSLVFIETTASALFLSKFPVEALPYAYILTAAVSTLLGLVYVKIEERYAPATLLRLTLAVLLAITLVLYGALWLYESKWFVMGLMIWQDVWWTLAGIEFWALAGFLFNVRQGKRLFGLIGSGTVVAGIIGGLAIPLILNDIGTLHLLSISAIGMVASLLVLTYILRFTALNFAPDEEEQEAEGEPGPLSTFFKDPYLRLFLGTSILSYMIYYLIDYVFYDRVEAAFPDAQRLASFFGVFFAVLNTCNLLCGAFVSGRLLMRFGLGFGLLLLPVASALATGTAIGSGWLFGMAGVFLWLVVVAKLCNEVLSETVDEHVFRLLYQPLPVGQRLWVQTVRESIGEPIATGLAGVLLLLCTSVASFTALQLLYIILALLVACIVISIFLRQQYPQVLMQALTKKRLRGPDITLEDQSSLQVLQRGLESSNASEVIHCVQILAENEHPSLASSLLRLLDHPAPQVRQYVLERIGQLQLSAAATLVRQRVAIETSAVVRGYALRTLCAISETDLFESVPPYLDHPEPEVKKGALVGLLRSGGIDGVLTAGAQVNHLMASPRTAERMLAAEILGEVGIFHFYQPLLRLLRDSDLEVRKAALEAAGHVRNMKLVPLLLEDLADITVRQEAFSALMQFGAEIISDLAAAFVQEGQQREIRIRIARLCGRIGGHEAIALLSQQVRFPDAAVRNHILSALALCKYRATPDEWPKISDAIRGEVEDATWALATIDDLGTAEEVAVLTQGLMHAVQQHRERALLLLSFLYEAEPVLQAKATLDSNSSDKRASALEVLDTFVAQDLKSLVFPLLDDLTAEARLASLQVMFPQRRLSGAERLQDIILSAPTRSAAWTRAGALFTIGKTHTIACRESTIAALADPDPVVRETAAWALSEIDSAAYQQQAETLRVDPSPMVRRTVARLTAERLAESPGGL